MHQSAYHIFVEYNVFYHIPVISTVAMTLVVADSSLSVSTITLVSIVTISTSGNGNELISQILIIEEVYE